MKTNFKVLSVFLVATIIIQVAVANNVRITTGERKGANRDEIEFTLSWDNSWYVNGIPKNHDAVWVFIKFRECGMTTYEWSHALLSTNMSDHVFGPDVTYAQPILATNRFGKGTGHNTGVMIRRKNFGKGNIVDQVCRLKVVGSSNGVNLDPTLEYDINVFGIEMVFIPQGAFYVGDGVSNNYIRSNTTNLPLYITDEMGVYPHYGQSSSWVSNILDSFPKGYASFYIMKYEITHGQYVDFLNTLTSIQASANYYNHNWQHHDLQHDGSQYTTSSHDRPRPYMNFRELLSYLDWAALRPMTELEFEKACRGILDYVPGEYAWGSGNASTAIEVRSVTGATPGVEVVSTLQDANCHINITTQNLTGGQFSTFPGHNDIGRGPVAAGIFARSTKSSGQYNRVNTGATYYGVMEMSGNVWEWCIQTTRGNNHDQPSLYTGIWGNGQLTSLGMYDVPGWPTSSNFTSYFCLRGGAYDHGLARARVSDRESVNHTDFNWRGFTVGGRGVR